MSEGYRKDGPEAKKSHQYTLALTLAVRVGLAILLFGGAAALAERLGFTKNDGAAILKPFLLFLSLGAFYGAIGGVRQLALLGIICCGLMGLLVPRIFTGLGAAVLFVLAPMAILMIICAVLKYPRRPNVPPA